MKKILFGLPLLLLFAACKNEPKKVTPPVTKDTATRCDFGIDTMQFNMVKQPPVENELVSRSKPVRPKPPVTPTGGVLLLDFDGRAVTGTSWNYGDNATILCSNANLSAEAMQLIFDSTVKKYARWKILVTTDEAVYNAASRRSVIVYTETWEWYGRTGGTSFLNSFGAGNNPAFVFTSLLNYNVKQIMEAGVHETGHTLGLLHQVSIIDGIRTGEYDYGNYSCCVAPIMGCAYYKPMSVFRTGINAYGTSVNEIALLDAKLGVK